MIIQYLAQKIRVVTQFRVFERVGNFCLLKFQKKAFNMEFCIFCNIRGYCINIRVLPPTVILFQYVCISTRTQITIYILTITLSYESLKHKLNFSVFSNNDGSKISS